MEMELLYGVDLNDYASIHNTTVTNIVNKTIKDIDILENNLNSIDDIMDCRVEPICKLLKKKRKHLEKLKDWLSQK